MEKNNEYDIKLEEMTQEALEGIERNLQLAYVRGGKVEFLDCLGVYNKLLNKVKTYIKRNLRQFSWDFSGVDLSEKLTAEKPDIGEAAVYCIRIPDWLNLYFPY